MSLIPVPFVMQYLEGSDSMPLRKGMKHNG